MTGQYKYTWGETVVTTAFIPSPHAADFVAGVCGIYEKEGKVLYLIEFIDGTSVEIEESSIRKITKNELDQYEAIEWDGQKPKGTGKITPDE